MPPDVVPGREDVGARGEQLLCELCSHSRSVRDVFAVDDAEVGLELVA
jgi:hypothetical protein